MKGPEEPNRAGRMAGASPGGAAPVGTAVKTTVERGHAYMVPRLYNVEITLKEIVRGEEARLRAEKLAIGPPEKGFEYLLAFIKFGYFERGRIAPQVLSDTGTKQYVSFGGGSVDITYTLSEGQFLAVSADGETEYPVPSVTQQPEPGLIGREFHPGEAYEGWILFQVPEDEDKPLLIFKREHVEGVYGIWSYIWFRLYRDTA
ncbi:MAG: hypothetical protein JXA46_12155 [Dehalococcoidales bacterium]|nr:hypothetical protein [Dehalococcoidales bacterium]